MLTLFIVKSGQPEADPKKSEDSFGEVVSKVIHAATLEEVNSHEVKTPWYGICYDNEQADEGLEVSLKIFLTHSDADVLIIYKRLTKQDMSKSPRLFRQNVRVRPDCLMPEYEYALKIDAILNGWII